MVYVVIGLRIIVMSIILHISNDGNYREQKGELWEASALLIGDMLATYAELIIGV